MDHLVKHRVGHWDHNIRELAAKALAVITPNVLDCICVLAAFLVSFSHKDMMLDVTPTLLLDVFSNDSAKRHGSILAIAELLLPITNSGKVLDQAVISKIRYSLIFC